MRTNKFGDKYCHTEDELRRVIDNSGTGCKVYLAAVDPPEGVFKATGEIRTNGDGELVCYIEADTETAVHTLAKQCQIETSV